MATQVRECDTRLDSKNRFTVRGAQYDDHQVQGFEDGRMELYPRVLLDPFKISRNSLSMIDSSVSNTPKKR